MNEIRKLTTRRYVCGCLSQHREGGAHAVRWVYCGNAECPFDELGEHRKHRP